MDRIGKIVGVCLAAAALGWTVQAQYRTDVAPGPGTPTLRATQEQARRALVENCVSGPDLQRRLDDIKAGREAAIQCVEQRRGVEPSGARTAASTGDWPDRYVVQVQDSGGQWQRPQGAAHGRVEAAWDEALRLCDAERASGAPPAVRIADSVTGLERVIDCRAPTRR